MTFTPKPGHVVNTIVLVIKQFVYAQKCLGKQFTKRQIVQKIKERYQFEKFNAKCNGTVNKTQEKWRLYNWKLEEPQSSSNNL